jgi:hypothetical protein
MFNDLCAYPWVLEPVRYRDDADLLAQLNSAIVAPAEKRLAPAPAG